MGEIRDLSRKKSICIIEDACQSLGSTYEGQQTGTIGDIGCFSLYASKVLTSGEGGFIATNDKIDQQQDSNDTKSWDGKRL